MRQGLFSKKSSKPSVQTCMLLIILSFISNKLLLNGASMKGLSLSLIHIFHRISVAACSVVGSPAVYIGMTRHIKQGPLRAAPGSLQDDLLAFACQDKGITPVSYTHLAVYKRQAP